MCILRFVGCEQFLHDPESSQTKMEWQYGGESCSGIFNSATSTAVLNFFLRTSTVSITYRILDPDSTLRWHRCHCWRRYWHSMSCL